jgi:hypothetical protein
MAFNSKEFQAGFLNQVTDRMSEMTDEAKAFKQKQIEASERNKALISTRTARANAAVSLGREALQYIPEGARSKAIIRTAMASGMTGVSELRNKLAKAHADAGLAPGQTLSINDVEAVINMPNIPDIDTKYIDMPLEQFAKETYGATAKATKVKDDTNIVGRLFGFGAMDRAREQLGKMDAMDGMSVADINAASRLAEFNALIPNAVMSFSETPRFSRLESFNFSKDIAKTYDDALNSREAEDEEEKAYSLLVQKAVVAGRKESDVGPAEILEAKKNARQFYAREKVKEEIEMYARMYGASGGFFDQQVATDQITNLMGEGYLDILKGEYGLDAKKSEEKIVKEKDDPLGFDEGDVGETIATEIETVTPIADSLPTEKHRPGGDAETGDFGSAAARRWDRQYGARYNADGTPIIVEPRPTDKEATVMVKNKYSQKDQEKNAQQAWDRKYKKTHNVDGTPKKLKGD